MSRVLKANLISESGKTVHIEDIQYIKISEESQNSPESIEEDVQDQSQNLYDQEQEIYDSIISKAKKDADTILQNIQEDAQKEKQQILDQAGIDAEKMCRQGYEDGYAQGMKTSKVEVAQCIENTSAALEELQRQYEAFIKDYEKNLHNLAVDIAQKILCTKIQEDQLSMVQLIKNAVASIKNTNWISVDVSDKMQELLAALKQDNLAGDTDKIITVQAKDLPEDSVIIETSESVIDASISVQLENLRELLEKCYSD